MLRARSKKIKVFFLFLIVIFSSILSVARAESVQRIEVQGSPEFVKRTKEALALLQNARELGFVQRYIKIIKEGERSGMRAFDEKPTYEVGAATWQHSALWYAGTIAHDSYHSKLYFDAKKGDKTPARSDWTGAEAERNCLEYQLKVLKALKADKQTLDYVAAMQKNPTYQGDPNSQKDYQNRWW